MDEGAEDGRVSYSAMMRACMSSLDSPAPVCALRTPAPRRKNTENKDNPLRDKICGPRFLEAERTLDFRP